MKRGALFVEKTDKIWEKTLGFYKLKSAIMLFWGKNADELIKSH